MITINRRYSFWILKAHHSWGQGKLRYLHVCYRVVGGPVCLAALPGTILNNCKITTVMFTLRVYLLLRTKMCKFQLYFVSEVEVQLLFFKPITTKLCSQKSWTFKSCKSKFSVSKYQPSLRRSLVHCSMKVHELFEKWNFSA